MIIDYNLVVNINIFSNNKNKSSSINLLMFLIIKDIIFSTFIYVLDNRI